MYLKINKSTSILLLLSLLLIAINSIVELLSSLSFESYIFLRSAVAVLIIFYLEKVKYKFKSYINIFLVLFIILFLFNFFLNIIDIYHLNNYKIISNICKSNNYLCELIPILFYKFKLFRFITLSSVFFSFPILIIIFSQSEFKKIDIIKSKKVKKVFIFLISAIIFSSIALGLQKVYLSTIQTLQVLNQNFDDRFTYKKGGTSYYGWIRVYSNFVINNTNEKSNILIPPQSDLYKMEGNKAYFRWFLYPRNLFHLGEYNMDEIDFFILSPGECNDGNCVWPDFEIEKEKIKEVITIDRESQEVFKVQSDNFNPEDYKNKWGLIKLY
jgi:hypothetical protein